MFKILFVVGLTIWISTAYGILIHERFNVHSERYSAPIGFAALLLTLQLLYYPAQLFNWPSVYIHVVSTGVYLVLTILSLFQIPKIFKQYLHLKTLWVFAYVLAFVFMFYHMSISIARADGQMYLNYIAQNIDIDHLNMFNLWTGKTGSEFVSVYFFQGYYHFASFLNAFVNVFSNAMNIGSSIDSIVIDVWGLGLLLAVMSSLMILNFVSFFRYKSEWISRILIVFALFYTNFYYWKVAFAFYGNSWRSLFMAMLAYYLYRWIKEENPYDRYLAAIVFGASIAASSSTLFIGFSLLLGVGYYLFKKKHTNVLEDLSVMAFPMVLYVLGLQYKDHFTVFLVLLPITIAFYTLRFTPFVKKLLTVVNGFFSKYAFWIFIVAMPAIAIIFSIVDMKTDLYYPWHFFHYFDNHANYDMVKDYLFLYSDPIEIGLNILRWGGIVLMVFLNRSSKENNYFLSHILLLAVFFLNPFATSFISKAFASNVYYRLFESLFNAFSEIVIFGYVLNAIWNHKPFRITVSSLLILAIVFVHVTSYVLEINSSSYGFYIKQGHEVLPLYKIKATELDVIRAFQTELKKSAPSGHQITVVSHVDGLRTFEPKVYQIFTPREYYTPGDRVNEDFYQIARLWYSWEERPKLDYGLACAYLNTYQVDYVINERYVNYEFDGSMNSCTEVVYQNDEFNLRRVLR